LRGLEDKAKLFVDVRFNALMLVAMGLALWLADHTGRKRRELDIANWKDAVVVGCSQALALIPGVSRSGATITAGLARRLKREDAARFSFLMSLPITTGAVIFEIHGAYKHGHLNAIGAPPLVMFLGILTSAVSGFWAIGFLLNYLKRHSVLMFVLWRIFVALLVFGLILSGFKSV
jgi:undecaprenyl-diphosphatase